MTRSWGYWQRSRREEGEGRRLWGVSLGLSLGGEVKDGKGISGGVDPANGGAVAASMSVVYRVE